MVNDILKCYNISKKYDNDIALTNATFTVKENDIIFICGHNGSGKSTILKLLSGVLKSDTGYINFRDSNNGCMNKYCFDKHVWVPQSVDEALASNIRIDELVSLKNRENLLDIANKINLKWLIDCVTKKNKYKLVCELSGGEKQLLVDLIALSQPKPILLLDEVFRSLDNNLFSIFWDAVNRCVENTSGCALIVTHDLKFAIENASRLFILKNGFIKYDIKPSEIKLENLALEIANIN